MSDSHGEPTPDQGIPAARGGAVPRPVAGPRRARLVVLLAVAAVLIVGAGVAFFVLRSDGPTLKWTAVQLQGFSGSDSIACPTATECWLVAKTGTEFGGELAQLVDGELEFVPLSGRADRVLCRTASDCWAVAADFGRHPPVRDVDSPYYHYDGTAWTAADPRTPSDWGVEEFFGCEHELCTVRTTVGSAVWDGDQWHEIDDQDPWPLDALSCAEVEHCVGINFRLDPATVQEELFVLQLGNGMQSVSDRSDQDLVMYVGISCPSGNGCVILLGGSVGLGYPGGTTAPTKVIRVEDGRAVEVVDGTSGLPPQVSATFTCTSMTNCLVAGEDVDGRGIWQFNGREWHRTTIDGMPADGTILAISCASDDHCWAVGTNGLILRGTPA